MKILGIAGYSGAGKTTLLEKLIPLLWADGVSVSVIKHVHCGFDIDQPGKDSYRHRQAGAGEVLVAGEQRWALMHENASAEAPRLQDLLDKLSPCDLVLVEGWKRDAIPKIEVHRAANGKPWLYPEDENIIAVASDVPPLGEIPWLGLDDIVKIRIFIKQHLGI
jgi:molybdopterin-guanine dinucleotide biosynthesis protein B